MTSKTEVFQGFKLFDIHSMDNVYHSIKGQSTAMVLVQLMIHFYDKNLDAQ